MVRSLLRSLHAFALTNLSRFDEPTSPVETMTESHTLVAYPVGVFAPHVVC